MNGSVVNMLWKVVEKDNMNINRKFQLREISVVPRELEKTELFYRETYCSQNFRYETLKSHVLKKIKMSQPTYSCETHLKILYITEYMDMNVYTLM